ncbi:MAG: hypothetical protein AB1397_03335 [bacterium]
MIAHLGYFQFWLDENGKKIDLTGSEAIRTFRIEKEARQDELIVTDALFQELQTQLKPNNISSVPFRRVPAKRLYPNPKSLPPSPLPATGSRAI